MRVIMATVVVLVLSGLSACGRKGELMPPEMSPEVLPSQTQKAPQTHAEPIDALAATP